MQTTGNELTSHMTQQISIIDAREESLTGKFRAVWDSRELLFHLVKRDLNGRYRATSIGRSWIFLRPAIEIMTYIVVFGMFLKVRATSMPYPLFLCCGLVPWLFFNQTVSSSAAALAGAQHIMSKVHFPRLIIPLSNLALALVDFVVLFSAALLLAAIYRMPVGLPLISLPIFVAMIVALAFGLSLLTAAWSVARPDLAIAVPVVLRMMMYLSPIVYPPSLVPAAIRPFYDLNPIAMIVTGIRWSLGDADAPSALSVALGAVVVVIALVAGLLAFARTERRMIDYL
jgi:lipopolysaccharide transport system permease protein